MVEDRVSRCASKCGVRSASFGTVTEFPVSARVRENATRTLGSRRHDEVAAAAAPLLEDDIEGVTVLAIPDCSWLAKWCHGANY